MEAENRLGLSQTVHDLDNDVVLKAFTDNGLSLARNEVKHFSVSENLTTGYEWILEKDGGECGDILSVHDSYDAPYFGEDDLELVGVSGTKYFSLHGVRNGQCTWRAAYARSWEFDWQDRIGRAGRLI